MRRALPGTGWITSPESFACTVADKTRAVIIAIKEKTVFAGDNLKYITQIIGIRVTEQVESALLHLGEILAGHGAGRA